MNRSATRSATITYAGKTQTLQQWAKELGISRNTLRHRLLKGYPIEEVMSPYPVSRGGISEETAIKNRGPVGCCLPDCENCPLPDCMNGTAPTREESRMLRAALISLPDTRSGFDHIYRSARKNMGILR